jgi:hypothetical protein
MCDKGQKYRSEICEKDVTIAAVSKSTKLFKVTRLISTVVETVFRERLGAVSSLSVPQNIVVYYNLRDDAIVCIEVDGCAKFGTTSPTIAPPNRFQTFEKTGSENQSSKLVNKDLRAKT